MMPPPGCQLWGEGKRGADGGVDGEMWFMAGPGREAGRLLVQVKGGQKPSVTQVREFKAVMDDEGAELGVFFSRGETTQDMRTFAAAAQTVRIGGREFPRLQLVTLGGWFHGHRPLLPVPVAIEIPKDKALGKKPPKRPDPAQPEFMFSYGGKAQEVPAGRVINPDVLDDDDFSFDEPVEAAARQHHG